MILLRTVLVLVACLLFCGCDQKGEKIVKRPGLSDVAQTKRNDPKMAEAIELARATSGEFLAALKSPGPAQSGFSIKVKVVEGNEIEHIWLNHVTFDGEKLHGSINNVPLKLQKTKFGDAVVVAPQELSDWMFLEGRSLRGGYTLRVVRNGLNESERADFDRKLPFKID